MENKGTTRINVDPKVLREGRDLMMPPSIEEKISTDEGEDV